MKNLTIHTSPVTGTIYAGKLTKDGTRFVGEKSDVTADACKAVFQHLLQRKQSIVYTKPDGTKYVLTVTPYDETLSSNE